MSAKGRHLPGAAGEHRGASVTPPGWRLTRQWLALAAFFLLAPVATVSGQQRSKGATSVTSPSSAGATPSARSDASSAASGDPLLAAMFAEVERSKTQLKMDNLSAPYYVEYHVADIDEFDAEAAYGALRLNQRTHGRNLRVVVRVGDYKQDSFGPGPGQGASDVAPLDDDPVALRRALWLATDRAYKGAAQALANKKATEPLQWRSGI